MSKLFAVAAEFDSPEALLEAIGKTRKAGYTKIETYTPFPIHGLREAIGFKKPILPWIVFGAGLTGMCGGFFLEYWVQVLNMPYNIGGKPLNSWPAFIPITFETTVLLASLTCVFGMLAFNGLPRHHHPIFNYPRFAEVMNDKFLLTIEAKDPKFDPTAIREFFAADLGSSEVHEVEDE
ncbi:MAG: DUF3341 domain-containing protein [Acidobacteria bacterium]|nr:DUF3341 domain-containing protein [Acidobacteriota bacterium]